MRIFEKLESKDKSMKSQFSRFAMVGGTSTVINYGVFFILFAFFSVNYLVASATGYIIGALFGYYFNARLTFKKKPGLSVLPYLAIYTLTLIFCLGILKFLASLSMNPLIANAIAIAIGTATNFLGSRYIAFNESLKIPHFFRSRLFLFVLAIKVVFAFLFASDFMTHLFMPFVKYFVSSPLSNPYQHFFDAGIMNAFPYPPVMLFMISIPYILFGIFGGSQFFDLFAMRLSLLFADILIFYILYSIFKGKEKYTLFLYWASPVVFYITYIHGQLDVLPVAFLFLSTYFLINKKYTKSSIMLGLGFAAKTFIFIALPIFIIYLIKKKTGFGKIIKFVSIPVIIFVLAILPYILSHGFFEMVFHPQEQLMIFNLSINFSQNLFYYIVPAAYAYIIFKAFSFKKITTEILFVLLGLTLVIFVTFINPARGWYLWAIPFMVYFFVRGKKLNIWIYAAFNAAYLLYFLFVQNSDVFNVFQIVSPQIASLGTPYDYLLASGFPAQLLVNLLFTALTSTLLYISYLIYKNGVKNSFIFQETNGIPAIGISGDSGTGKTTLSELLTKFFGRERVTMIYGDDVHRWERGDENWNKYTHLNPAANMIHANYIQLKTLKSGHSITRKYYDHKTGKFTKPILITPKEMIITEGLHSLFINESNRLYEIKIYMDPDPDLKLFWKIKRDVLERHYTLKQVTESLKKRKEDSEKFISPQKFNSDIVLAYKPLNKIDFRNLDGHIELFMEAYVKSDIYIEPLLMALAECKTLRIDIEYLDARFQKIVFRGNISLSDLEKALKMLNIDYEEYGVNPRNFSSGMDGIAQILVLMCLNERLKIQTKVDENEL